MHVVKCGGWEDWESSSVDKGQGGSDKNLFLLIGDLLLPSIAETSTWCLVLGKLELCSENIPSPIMAPVLTSGTCELKLPFKHTVRHSSQVHDHENPKKV